MPRHPYWACLIEGASRVDLAPQEAARVRGKMPIVRMLCRGRRGTTSCQQTTDGCKRSLAINCILSSANGFVWCRDRRWVDDHPQGRPQHRAAHRDQLWTFEAHAPGMARVYGNGRACRQRAVVAIERVCDHRAQAKPVETRHEQLEFNRVTRSFRIAHTQYHADGCGSIQMHCPSGHPDARSGYTRSPALLLVSTSCLSPSVKVFPLCRPRRTHAPTQADRFPSAAAAARSAGRGLVRMPSTFDVELAP